MRRCVWIVAVAVLVAVSPSVADRAAASIVPCGLLSPCPAPSPPPPPTATTPPEPVTPTSNGAVADGVYDGHTGTRTYIDFKVAKSGKRVTRFEFRFRHGRCSDGGPFMSGGGTVVHKGAVIDGAGSASRGFVAKHAFEFTRRGRQVRGIERPGFTVHFRGDTATGTLRDRFSSRSLRCETKPISFTAYLDGTPKAPVHDGAVTTSRYRGYASDRTGSHARHEPLALYAVRPWRAVTYIEFGWHLRCPRGKPLKQTTSLGFLPLRIENGADSVAYQSRWRVNFKNHVQGRFSAGLQGQFSKEASYKFVGAWNFTEDFYRGRNYLGTCSADVSLSAHQAKR
jgi:hypothetical protein